MSLLGKSPQEKYGAKIIKRIQKAAKPNIADVGIGVLKSVQKGLNTRIKNNLERIDSNFEDEEIRLTNLYNDFTQTDNLVKDLEKKGNGNLVTGIMYDKVSKFKDTASISGFEARINKADSNDNFFVQLQKEAQNEAAILRKRLKELGSLRTSYDPENPDEGILSTNLQTEEQFKSPLRKAIKNISLNQKTKGQNNALDVVMSALNMSSRSDYSMMDDFYEQEASIDKIIQSSLAARDALPIYSGDSELLKNYIAQKEDERNGKSKINAENVSDQFTKVAGQMKFFVDQKLKLQGDGSFYFFPKRDDLGKELKPYTNEEFEQFLKTYGYDRDYINELYFKATTFGEKSFQDNTNVLARLKQSDSNMLLSADNERKLAAIEATELYHKHRYDINSVPPEKRRLVVSLLNLDIKGIQSIDDDVYLQISPRIQQKIPTFFSDDKEIIYNRLNKEAKMTFNYTVISHADLLKQESGLDEDKAINVATNVQKLGVTTGAEYTELFGAVTERDYTAKLPAEEFFQQPFVPYNSKEGRIVQPILDYYPPDQILTESNLESLIQQINNQQIYFYEPATIENKNPEMFRTGEKFSIGQAIVAFNRTPDENGNRWTRIK